MIIVMKSQATKAEIDKVIERVNQSGLKASIMEGESCTIVGIIGDKRLIASLPAEALDGVDKVLPVSAGYKLVSRDFHPASSIVEVGDLKIGSGSIVVMAGPCAVESREQLLEAAHIVKDSGGHMLRGGAYKPRTSPYSFQGLETKGLEYLAEAREATGLKIVTEVTEVGAVEVVSQYADMLQIGARNMQNFHLLKIAGRSGKPILLKRGIAATIDEWLHAAEYIVNEGNPNVVLCERGIRTYEEYTRNTLDLSAVPAIKHLSHLPIVVDPSHGTGKWRMVRPMSLASVAAGADGLMIEVHPDPQRALSDGPQSLTPENYASLMAEVRELSEFLARK